MKMRRRFHGQSLVEFAMVFPLIIFLMTGFFDLSRAIFYYSSLSNAVREATRYAIVNRNEINAAYNNPTDNTLQTKVLDYAFALADTPNPLCKDDVVVSLEKVNDLFTTVSIQATYSFNPITPGIQELFRLDTGINLIAQSTMLVTPGAK